VLAIGVQPGVEGCQSFGMLDQKGSWDFSGQQVRERTPRLE